MRNRHPPAHNDSQQLTSLILLHPFGPTSNDTIQETRRKVCQQTKIVALRMHQEPVHDRTTIRETPREEVLKVGDGNPEILPEVAYLRAMTTAP